MNHDIGGSILYIVLCCIMRYRTHGNIASQPSIWHYVADYNIAI